MTEKGQGSRSKNRLRCRHTKRDIGDLGPFCRPMSQCQINSVCSHKEMGKFANVLSISEQSGRSLPHLLQEASQTFPNLVHCSLFCSWSSYCLYLTIQHLIRHSCTFLANCFGCVCPVSGEKLQLPLEQRLTVFFGGLLGEMWVYLGPCQGSLQGNHSFLRFTLTFFETSHCRKYLTPWLLEITLRGRCVLASPFYRQ